jgi:hypothetical protein
LTALLGADEVSLNVLRKASHSGSPGR